MTFKGPLQLKPIYESELLHSFVMPLQLPVFLNVVYSAN